MCVWWPRSSPTTPTRIPPALAVARLCPDIARRSVLGFPDACSLVTIDVAVPLGRALEVANVRLLGFELAVLPTGDVTRPDALLNAVFLDGLAAIYAGAVSVISTGDTARGDDGESGNE